MGLFGKKILLIGERESGATAVFWAVKQGIPQKATVLFEPEKYHPRRKDEKWGVLAKIVLHSKLDIPSFLPFDKKVLIVRDPRDRMIDELLYNIQGWFDGLEALEPFMDLLEKKGNNSSSVSMKELWATRFPHCRMAAQFEDWMRKSLEVQEFFNPVFVIKYEDFIDGNVQGLEDFLGFAVDHKVHVSPVSCTAGGSKSCGAWRDWFVPQDVDFFKPVFAHYLEKYGYADDWVLHKEPSINKENSSGCVLRVVNEKRKQAGLSPIRVVKSPFCESRGKLVAEDDVANFDWQLYLRRYIDLQRAGIKTKEKAEAHYVHFGKKEGRQFSRDYSMRLAEPGGEAVGFKKSFLGFLPRGIRRGSDQVLKKCSTDEGPLPVKTFKYNGSLEDIIYSLPTIIALGGGVLYIGDRSSDLGLSPNAPRPVPVTDEMIEGVLELLKKQPYLVDVKKHHFEKADYNLDAFWKGNWTMQHLAETHLEACSAKFNLGKSWLQGISPLHVSYIIINRTERRHSHDPAFDWSVLKGYESFCSFIGFEKEYLMFKEDTGLRIERYEVKSALEMARVIKGSKLFVGNQSLGFSIAEAMKHPRVLEFDSDAPNCMPQSLNGYVSLNRRVLKRALAGKCGSCLPLWFQNIFAKIRNYRALT